VSRCCRSAQRQLFRHVHAANRVPHQSLAAQHGILPTSLPRSRSGVPVTAAGEPTAQQAPHKLDDPGDDQHPKNEAYQPANETMPFEALACASSLISKVTTSPMRRGERVYASRKATRQRNCVISIGCAAEQISGKPDGIGEKHSKPIVILYLHNKVPAARKALFSSAARRNSVNSHIRTQCFWNHDRAVRLLIVLDHRNPGAATASPEPFSVCTNSLFPPALGLNGCPRGAPGTLRNSNTTRSRETPARRQPHFDVVVFAEANPYRRNRAKPSDSAAPVSPECFLRSARELRALHSFSLDA